MDMEKFPFFKSLIGYGESQVDTAHRDILFTYLPHLSPQIATEAVSQVVRAAVREFCDASCIWRVVTHYLR